MAPFPAHLRTQGKKSGRSPLGLLINSIFCFNKHFVYFSNLIIFSALSSFPCFICLFLFFHRQSNVEDLKKLARQFDANMQQDEESSEQLNFINNDLCRTANSSEAKPTTASLPINVKNLKCPSSSDQVEAELHALFDCSTQGGSGRLSEGSACSQEMVHQPVSAGLAKCQQTELLLAHGSGTAEQKETCSNGAKNCDEFYDDWENDDLLNDSFILAITQNPHGQDATPETTQQPHTNTKLPSVLNSHSAHKPTDGRCNTSSSALQELCPKPKAKNRSTFRLEPNPHFQSKVNKEALESNFTVIHPTLKGTAKNSAASKMQPTSQTSKVTNIQAEAPSADDISDSLWDDGDDELLYQVCDSVERISNSQPKEVNPNNCRGIEEETADRQVETKIVPPIGTTGSIHSGVSANSKRSSGAFVRSNSLPGTSCKTSYQGWNIPMKGANNKSRMSESFPESGVNQGTFNHGRDFSGTFQAGNSNMDAKLQTAAARGQPDSKSHQRAFKRNVSDSAIISSKGKKTECGCLQIGCESTD